MTEFSEAVLEATRRIPRGKVATYSDIARAIGKPKAARAVGSALRKNKTPIIIPCHRVVRSDGRLGGYSGSASKESLLKSEGVRVSCGRIDLREFSAEL
jgi:O-6-methylguanine DNA methyltransferase